MTPIRAAIAIWIATTGGAPMAVGGPPQRAEDAAPPPSESVLEAAFENRFDVDLVSQIDLVMRDRTGRERRRTLHAVSKRIDGRVHSVGRLLWPEELRGMTLLTIEAVDRSQDAFVYLPSLRRVRRIGSAQRADSFLGSDLTYEDLERPRPDAYELFPLVADAGGAEPVYRVRGRARRSAGFAEALFVIAQTDAALLETWYFKPGAPAAYRVIRAPRAEMVQREGHVLPTKLRVENLVRGTSTEVAFRDLRVNPPIDDRIFSVTTLEQQRDLPEPAP